MLHFRYSFRISLKTDPERVNLIRRVTTQDVRIGAITRLDKNLLAVGNKNGMIFLIDLAKPEGEELVGVLKKHKEEVCSLSCSCDGQYLASGGNDDRVNIWNVSSLFESKPLTLKSHCSAIKALAWNPLPKSATLLATGGGVSDNRRYSKSLSSKNKSIFDDTIR